ncbi:MAG TPA: hypothetical protein PLO61_00235 [Fimbriimonadaceae bacterium]|nr:hypothetical protein [Fimbriimonadaceae bacterium]HRJ33491.1 hypothetical protein [Fimbriimonadaceae bacterium]
MSDIPLVLIAGISCSGKTTLADQLAFRLGATKVSIDDYYYGFDSLSDEEKQAVNFDDPSAIEHGLLLQHLRQLIRGEAVDMPKYDHETFSRSHRPSLVQPGPAVIVEGLFALVWDELVSLTPTRIFVETRPEVAFQRRFMRDTVAFHRDPAAVLARHQAQVVPCQDTIVLPSRSRATMVVSGEEPLDGSVQKIAEALIHLKR